MADQLAQRRKRKDRKHIMFRVAKVVDLETGETRSGLLARFATDRKLMGERGYKVGDTLRAEVEQARGTAEYWKAGLLDANAEVERLHKSQGAEMFLTLTGEITNLRAEVEQLKIRLAWVEPCEPNHEDVKRLVAALSYLGVSTPESMEEAAIRWLSLVRTLIRQASDSKLLRQDSEKLAEVERLRKDAERITWLAAQARMIYGHKGEASYQLSELPELIQSSREECLPDDLRQAIDAAKEASR